MKRDRNLHSPFNTLNKPKQQSQEQNHDRNPKCIPLETVSTVIPPLTQCFWRRFIKYLLEFNDSVMPEVEVSHMSVNSTKVSTLGSTFVETFSRGNLAVPFSRFGVGLWEQESECFYSLFDESFWIYFTMSIQHLFSYVLLRSYLSFCDFKNEA